MGLTVPVRPSADVGPGAGAGTRRQRWSRLAPPALLLVLGGWLLSRRYGFWYDELYTAEVVRVPLAELWQAFVRGEGTIPYLRDAPPSYNFPYYVVAHVWLAATGLGPGEVGLRLLSLLAMAGGVAVFTRAATRVGGTGAGLAAGLALAANPFVVLYAAEARSYGLAVLATAAAALGLARWLDGRSGLRLYGLAGAAAGLMHWFALLPVAALAAAAVALRGRRQAGPVLVAAALAAVPTLAVVGTAVANGVGGSGAEWIVGKGLAVPRLLLRSWTVANWPLLVVTVAAAAAGLLRAGRAPRTVAAAWVLLPVLAVTAVEHVRPVVVDRYLLPSLLGLALLVGMGVASLPRRAFAAGLAVVVGVSGWAAAGEVRLGPEEDVRGAMAYVAAAAAPGEPVVAAARWDALGADHYARRHHPELAGRLVLPASPLPDEPALWVVRRAKGGVKGDRTKLDALDADLAARGLHLAGERRFEGRSADVLVQRWTA